MENICLDVYMPSINKRYDIVVSQEITVKAAAEYILKTICEYEELEYKGNSVILCSINKKRILAGELTLKEAEVTDGSKLMLI